MNQTENSREPPQPTDAADESVTTLVPRGLVIVIIAFGFAVMAITLLLKYLITGSVVRDRFGWILLGANVVLGVLLPLWIFRRKQAKDTL